MTDVTSAPWTVRSVKDYLGDGVYVAFDGFGLWLSVEDGVKATDEGGDAMSEERATTQEFAAALRRLADFYDEHPDVPTPAEPLHVNIVSVREEKREVERLARLLAPVSKLMEDSLFVLSKDFGGGLCLRVLFWRRTVCTRRVIGIKRIPAEPAQPARNVEEVEWDCHAILDEEATP